MSDRDDVIERLQAGHHGLQISNESRRAHIQEIERLLDVSEFSKNKRSNRRFVVLSLSRSVAIVVGAFFLGFGVAAGYDGVPGDWLYGIKRVAEEPAQIIDGDIVATNRVGELETLIARGAAPEVVAGAADDAAEAVADREPGDELMRLLALLVWPAPLTDEGPDVTIIPGSVWMVDGGYTAALADGHLVTVNLLDDELVVSATGGWVVEGTDRLILSNPGVAGGYLIERRGDDLLVRNEDLAGEQALTEGGSEAGSEADGTDRATFSSTSKPSNTSPPPSASTTTSKPTPSTTSPLRPTSTRTSKPTTSTTRPRATTTTTAPAPSTTTGQTTNRPTTTTRPGGDDDDDDEEEDDGAPAPAWLGYLTNPGSGNTSSLAVLPLSTGSAPGGSLANFDTDRDGARGLLIQKDGAGLGTGDRTKYQEWRWTAPATTTFEGRASLTIWVAAKDFATDERIGLRVALEVCSPGCTRIGSADWSGLGSTGFSPVTVDLGSVRRTVAAGSGLRLRVVVPDSLATTDLWLAYDAATNPSRLRIG